MLSFRDDPSIERFAARRATGWHQRDSAVVLEVEGVREPDRTGIAAILAGARLNDALERTELSISVLESGAVRLQLGTPTTAKGHGALDEDELTPAPISVTTSEGGLHVASERHGGYGPDPEDLTIEVTLDPLGITVVDAGGRAIIRLAAELPAEADQAGIAPFAWIRSAGEAGEPRRATTVSLALESEERLYGLGQRSGPLNLVGTTTTVTPALVDGDESRARPPFLLSSRGYGVLVHTVAGLTAELRHTVVVGVHHRGRRAGAGSAALSLNLASDGARRLRPADRSGAPTRTYRLFLHNVRQGPGRCAIRRRRDAGTAAGSSQLRADDARLLAGRRPVAARPLAVPGTGDPLAEPLISFAPRVVMPPWADGVFPDDGRVSDIEAGRAWSLYAGLRQRLLPYLVHCARETAQIGLPMLRPLLLEFSWDPEAVDVDDQFLLGRDLLVAPVFSDTPEPVTRRVYLPAYANWYDWWTGTLYEGKQWVETTVPLHHVPIYVRAGTVIPLTNPHSGSSDTSVDVTRLLLFAPRDGAIGASVEYGDDDTLGVEQERGERKTRIYLEGIPSTVRDLQIVGLPASAHLVDASARTIVLEPGDDQLPGLGGRWASLIVRLDVGAFTAGLELGW